MAKSSKQAEPDPVVEQKVTNKLNGFYAGLVSSLSSLAVQAYPVTFEPIELQHFSGNAEKKEGIFVRAIDIHDQEKLKKLEPEEVPYDSPMTMLWLVLRAACAFDGSSLFDPESEEHMRVLVGAPLLTKIIFSEAMITAGLYSRVPKALAKNSVETPRPSSESGSVLSSEELSASLFTAHQSIGLLLLKNGYSIEQLTPVSLKETPLAT